MKKLIMITLCIALLTLGGCGIENYKCKKGEHIGEYCCTEPETIVLENVIGKIAPYDEPDFADITSPYIKETMHQTGRYCVIEVLDLVNVTDFEINDSSINFKIITENNKTKDILFEDYKEYKRIFLFNATFNVRWNRIIWTGRDYCSDEVEKAGGEVYRGWK